MAAIWYFAYGSNMDSATLRGRRGISFRRAVPARAVGWQLVFDKPPVVPIGESFANIVSNASAHVLGVAFEVGAENLKRIELTEGVRAGNYDRLAVPVEPLSQLPAASLVAFTLTSNRRDPKLRPSTRYMGLLISGAVEHGLPAEYVDYLRTVPAQPETADAVQFRALLDQVMRRI